MNYDDEQKIVEQIEEGVYQVLAHASISDIKRLSADFDTRKRKLSVNWRISDFGNGYYT